jgi:hypothetical protein
MSNFAGTATARVGWGDPDVFGVLMGLRIRVSTSAAAVVNDLTTVTNVDLFVERSTGEPEIWAATVIESTTMTAMTLFHPYIVGDLPRVETLKITPRIYTPSGMYPCTPFRLNVVKG